MSLVFRMTFVGVLPHSEIVAGPQQNTQSAAQHSPLTDSTALNTRRPFSSVRHSKVCGHRISDNGRCPQRKEGEDE